MSKVKSEVLEAFKMMWGLYPGPVMLIHASREILAVNEAAAGLGLPLGITCHSLYPSDKPCPGCLAGKALRQQQGVRRAAWAASQRKFMDGFWVPVAGEEAVFVHFGNDITDLVRPELLPDDAQ